MVIFGRAHRIRFNRYPASMRASTGSGSFLPNRRTMGQVSYCTYQHHLHAWLRMISGVRQCLSDEERRHFAIPGLADGSGGVAGGSARSLYYGMQNITVFRILPLIFKWIGLLTRNLAWGSCMSFIYFLCAVL
ncbi:hypothetical protein HNY73_004012 [Argiope bruennichi]|uniref:Uncharacterized protein n=1 Tax=Argiope bruennichi TaxID=94029 RepID=A0A8T0FMJ7_ARGBR|nr:hypothetical protein HNY73_004012 [Argiope bruennichi]